MDIITSHTNADFDALASMVAAKKLYPGAKLVFPGSQEKSMRDFFLESAFYALEAERLRNIDVTKVDPAHHRRQPESCAARKAVRSAGTARPASAYLRPSSRRGRRSAGRARDRGRGRRDDHAHGRTAPEAARSRSRRSKRRSSPSASMRKPVRLPLSRHHERDALAAAYLIGQGAQLTIVSDFISRELTPEQQQVLQQLRWNPPPATTSTACAW